MQQSNEYWVNVYEFGPNIFGYGSELCLNSSNYMIEKGSSRVLYRIHVKLDGGYNKHRYARGMDSKRYADLNKLNWMG